MNCASEVHVPTFPPPVLIVMAVTTNGRSARIEIDLVVPGPEEPPAFGSVHFSTP